MKSILSAIPYMSFLKMSIIVIKRIKSIRRNFIWGWKGGGRGFHGYFGKIHVVQRV